MTAVPVPAAGERPVGREAELALLARAAERLVDGRGSIVEITGEPGIGKTRLALTLMELAARRGVPVVRAHAIRGNTVPFQVLRDAWETRRGPGAEPFDAGRDRIAEWAGGCVLVLDDLHWCDPDSAAVLARLVRSVVPGPLLLTLVHRPGQTAPGLREALEDGVRTGTVTRLEPGPLDRESVATLLAGWRVPLPSEAAAWGEAGASGSLLAAGSSTSRVGIDASTRLAASALTELSPDVSAGLAFDALVDRPLDASVSLTLGASADLALDDASAGMSLDASASLVRDASAGMPLDVSADLPRGASADLPPGASADPAPDTSAHLPTDASASLPAHPSAGPPPHLSASPESDVPARLGGSLSAHPGGGLPRRLERGAPAIPPSQEFVARLCAAADGNPRYLRLLVAADWRPEHWPDRAGTDPAGLLREAKALVAELDALTEGAAVTASAAAVVGSPFRPEDVAQVSGLGLDSTLDALAELERADLVRSAGWTGGLTFRHPVVGHVAHERAGVSFRLRAHRRALELSAGRAGRAHERARHAEHLLGVDAALAVRALAEGAAEVVVREPATAARWLRSALEALPTAAATSSGAPATTTRPHPASTLPTTPTPPTPDTTPTPTRTELELAYCRALIASGQWHEARARVHELLGNPQAALDARQALQAHAVCANAERQLGRYAEAAAIAGAGLGAVPRPLPDPLSAEAVELIIEYGLVHVLRGTHDQARDLLREALRTPAETADADLVVLRVLNALCATHAGDLAEAADEVTRCARLVDALPDPLAGRTPETLALLGSAELYLERFADAGRHLGRGLAAESRPQRPILLHRLLGLAAAELWTGRLDESQRHARQVEALARALGAQPAVTLAQAIRATALVWARGRSYADEAVALVEEAAGAGPTGHSWWTASATGLLAQARLLAGDAAGCRRTILDGGGGRRLPLVRPFSRPLLLSLLTTATLDCGDHEEARRLVGTAEAEAGRLGLPVQEAYAQCARARIHMADGEHDAAAKLLELAAESFRSTDMPVQYAWTLAMGVRSVHESRGEATALAHLDAAEAIARAHAAGLVRERVADLRAELSADGRTTHPVRLLSDREREIAELAASGLRTRQIAERLFLSPRTVETHLSRIYRKLDVSSRLALSDVLRSAP
ncbi:helix-turn-helix transcriptional regulator [Streptomyces griseorubiginosus]|uniref:helix-turn-helix transcriptional regulator n=1 Tax=Streptomyces griseorubiginosus TaxID=67304 RepID=UPI002E81B32F|nr:LuxR C-terminal-related transcriptional regulator [Streptomyces griseorubiginosus]WUB48966.1 LuxR C-terminal-related transcriptional regulator [Streptomyces griseorubiginosus]WUB57493.1 LuxR C-terminal-related transcriptional regulator [Streptomyces griseorubiginosus]